MLLSLEQEIELGRKTDSTIRANPQDFPILDPEQYSNVYAYFNSMMSEILQSDEFNYRDEFEWSITIINKDVMNAFAVPGGRIYFYTGLVKYLENSAQVAGVLAHEMAHIDLRHSNKQLTKAYGLDFMLSMIIGDSESELKNVAKDMAVGVASLQFSRDNEYEADEHSIKYLIDTDYHPKGIEGFFLKLQQEGHTGQTFEFLSTHPSDQNRIDNINKIWQENGSVIGELFIGEYNSLVEDLP